MTPIKIVRLGNSRPDYGKDEDAALIALARARDDVAFAELVRRRQGKVRKFMRYLAGDRDDGDDLAQQVFLKAWKTIRQLRSVAAFDGWLKRIMVTTWIEQTRKRQISVDDGVDSAGILARQETPGIGLDLEAALGTLSPAERLCIVLAYHDGQTQAEIAELAGMPLGTVKSHMNRGSARLREILAAYSKVD